MVGLPFIWLGRWLGLGMGRCGMVGRYICERIFRSLVCCWRRKSQSTDMCAAAC